MNTWESLPYRLWLAGALLFFLAGPAPADAPEGYPFVSFDEGLTAAAKQDRHVFLYFGRYGCGWCEKTNRESFSDPHLKALYSENYVLVYVDAESGRRMTLPGGERITEMELGARMNVYATPVFGFLKPDGETIFTVPGFKTADEFRSYHRFVSGGHYREQRLFDFLASESP